MVALLFTAVFIVGLLAIVLYFWAPRAHRSEQNLLPPLQSLRGLFSDENGIESAALPAAQSEREAERESTRISLRERAKSGDKSALDEAFDKASLANTQKIMQFLVLQGFQWIMTGPQVSGMGSGVPVSAEEAYWAPPLVTFRQLITAIIQGLTHSPGTLGIILFAEQPNVPYAPAAREQLASKRSAEQIKLLVGLLLVIALIAAPILLLAMR